MTVRSFAHDRDGPSAIGGLSLNLTRKTRLMAKSGVMLVRVEMVRDGVVRSSHLRLITPLASEIFSDLDQALGAFRMRVRRPAEKPRLKAAA